MIAWELAHASCGRYMVRESAKDAGKWVATFDGRLIGTYGTLNDAKVACARFDERTMPEPASIYSYPADDKSMVHYMVRDIGRAWRGE